MSDKWLVRFSKFFIYAALVIGIVIAARHLLQLQVWEALPMFCIVFLAAAARVALYLVLTRRAS